MEQILRMLVSGRRQPTLVMSVLGISILGLSILGISILGALAAPAALADSLDEIGYTRLVTLLGNSTPNGKGVAISQVEASNSSGAYFPDKNSSHFTAATDPLSEPVNFTDGSRGEDEGTTGHSTNTVGNNFYGNTASLAGAANEVTIYEANDWLDNVLNMATSKDPRTQDFRVQNFSWIGTFSSDSLDRKALRRFDYIIDTDEVTAVVGLNNNTNPLPHLLGNSYNAIAVGRTDGSHSTGPTQSFYGPGRTKPDLVVPRTTTSSATAMTSSAATLLHQAVVAAAEPVEPDGPVETDGDRSEVIRAMLLAGATKEEITGWAHAVDQPLDSHFGAGELNVYNSYLMTLGGQFAGHFEEPATAVGAHGWDYQVVTPSSDRYYNFEIPAGSTAAELSVVLAWNVEVTDTKSGPTFIGSESLANLGLALYDSSDVFLGSLLDQSRNTRRGLAATNGSDFAVGWYGDGQGLSLYRSTTPAWNNPSLRELAAHIRSGLFLARIRTPWDRISTADERSDDQW
jgi:hypothetical protein